MSILSQNQISDLFKSFDEQFQQLPPLPHVKPSQIEKLPEGIQKIEWQKKFADFQYLYVYPLEKLLEYITKQNGQTFNKLDYQDASLLERVLMNEKLLEQRGYTKDQIKKLIPVSEDQQNLLLKAKSLGFKDDVACYNDYRVESATQYIDSLNTTEEMENVQKGIA